jgi:hypothetical protein
MEGRRGWEKRFLYTMQQSASREVVRVFRADSHPIPSVQYSYSSAAKDPHRAGMLFSHEKYEKS